MAGTPGRSGGHNRRSRARKGVTATIRQDRDHKSPVRVARPARPEWLTDAVSTAAWDRIVGLLEARGTLSAGDADAVLLAAVAESEYRKADALLERDGLVVNGSAHPAVKIRADAWKRWSSALSRLGLDPITRHRVDPAPDRPANPFGDFA